MPASSELHIRRFRAVDLELRDGDAGLTVTGLVVPYGVETPITEARPDGVIKYREMFVPGAFQRAQRVPYRTTLTYDHDTSVGYRLGYGLGFTDTPEGLVGEFKLDGSTAAKARDILGSSHKSFSVGFWSINPRAFTERADSLAEPAYAGAGVTSIRSAEPDLDGEPTEAEIAAEQQQRADAQLLADLEMLAAEQEKWNALRS